MARFFVDRPIFATVISVVIVLAGLVAMNTLPIAQYPEVTPPNVLVTTQYPGANALTVRDTVAAPLEEQVSGVEGMMYMSSQSTNDGAYKLTVTFKPGTDADVAQVLVQNRVSLAIPQLPTDVQRQVINVKKSSPNTLLIVNLVSDDKTHTDDMEIYLSNYATIAIKDELLRLEGVADISYLGQRDYSLRAWLDIDKMATLGLSGQDVVTAISQQNVQVAAGQVGQQPVPRGQRFQLTINTKGLLVDPEEFADIILKGGNNLPSAAGNAGAGPVSASSTTSAPPGVPGTATANAPPGGPGTASGQSGPVAQDTPIVRLRDVARVELGSQQYDQACTLDGKPSVALSVYQLPGSNALQTAANVYGKMKELEKRFPPGMHYSIVYDTTPFINQSVQEVFTTLRDAVVLVAIVVLVFLQDWRAMILPMIDVPVSLIGTFAVMAALGYTLNNLTLFGLVLAIGIVVDDAIVVLENIERLIATGLDARTATIQAMDEITGPVLAITLVLSSVFVPCCFIGGVSGKFFQQFAVTIAVSTIISAINALTMTPARAVLIFKGEEGHGHVRQALPWWFFGVLLGLFTMYYGQTLLVEYLGWTFHTPEVNPKAQAYLHYVDLAVYFMPGALVGGALGLLIIRPVNAVLGWCFRLFNQGFDLVTEGYGRAVGRTLRVSLVVLVLYVGLLGLTAWEFVTTPSGFVPQQDKGYLLVNVQLDEGASVKRTQTIMKEVEDVVTFPPQLVEAHPEAVDEQQVYALEKKCQSLNADLVARGEGIYRKSDGGLVEGKPVPAPGREWSPLEREVQERVWARKVGNLESYYLYLNGGIYHVYGPKRSWIDHIVGISGQSIILNANGSNLGSMYVMLAPFDDRKGYADETAQATLGAIQTACTRIIQGAKVSVFNAPPIDGLGTTGGFKLIVEDRGSPDLDKQLRVSDEVVVRIKYGYDLQLVPGGEKLPDQGKNLIAVQDDQGVLRFRVFDGGKVVVDTDEKSLADKGEQLASLRSQLQSVRFNDELTPAQKDQLIPALKALLGPALGQPMLPSVQKGGGVMTPWLWLDIDRTRCVVEGIQVSDIFSTLQVYLGSYYVNNFTVFGRTWQVNIQADQSYRSKASDILRLQVRNSLGQMVQLRSILRVRPDMGPLLVSRYNLYSAVAITADVPAEMGSGEALTLMRDRAQDALPSSMGWEWTDLAYLQADAGSTAMLFFALAVVFVFLVLAAQYESWSLPLAVILVVPMCLLCSLIGVQVMGLEVTIFTQIGFVVLVGLASKNAILIVEFAKQQQEAGVARREATLQACRLRLRPILMTSFAFIFGVVPLVIAEGAGAEMRQSLGTAVFSGMVGVTLFGIFLTPVFYYVIQGFGGGTRPVHPTGHAPHADLPPLAGAEGATGIVAADPSAPPAEGATGSYPGWSRDFGKRSTFPGGMPPPSASREEPHRW